MVGVGFFYLEVLNILTLFNTFELFISLKSLILNIFSTNIFESLTFYEIISSILFFVVSELPYLSLCLLYLDINRPNLSLY